MRQYWVDIRDAGPSRTAVCVEALQHGVEAIVADDPAHLADLPRSVTRILMPRDFTPDALTDEIDAVILDSCAWDGPTSVPRGSYVEVTDPASLERACHAARTQPWCVVRFADPTMIPLEIVLAAAAGAAGRIVTVASDPEQAAVIFGVLERGPHAVMLAPTAVGEVHRLALAAQVATPALDLVELSVVGTSRAGMGERACIDTCSYLRPDEGLLIGSHSKGMVLCVSETHPLPYMPTRPFRVNAGAIMSYTLADAERTSYLSELHAGSTVLAVDARGNTRTVTVGRTKIESRPLLSIDAVSSDGRPVNLILQNDWHVRVLAPGGVVRNCTELIPGDRLLGYLPTHDRHVGYPIDELCYER
jgi:3-amino-4-hydroxybenzoic acid synthase